jgi:two-component system invasion response regulator UvrY
MRTLGDDATGALHEQLTPREHEIFLKLVYGESVCNIASRLHISPKTVSTHKTRILKKLELSDAFSLIRYAIDHDLSP